LLLNGSHKQWDGIEPTGEINKYLATTLKVGESVHIFEIALGGEVNPGVRRCSFAVDGS